MHKKTEKHRLLIHCRLPQIREGFELHLENLGIEVETRYTDLSVEGIGSKLKFKPNLIIVLLNESDEEMTLSVKLKMFATDVALLWITPTIPQCYYALLQTIGIRNIIQLPEQQYEICDTIRRLLCSNNGFP